MKKLPKCSDCKNDITDANYWHDMFGGYYHATCFIRFRNWK